jgi:glycosyltransferase involved in cell wall biosynthesis
VSVPTIAVVIPCRNDAPLLRRCLAALEAGSRVPDRVVVVDNASDDDSADVARAHGATVVREPELGIWPASAAGYDAVSEDVIARLDADSVPARDWVERAVAHFSVIDGPDFLTGRGRFYGNRKLVNFLGDHLYLGGMYVWVTPYLGHPPLFGSCMAMRRDAWVQVRGLVHRTDTTIHDDLDLSFQVRPWMTVVRDDDWFVGVSARPFDTWGGLGRRLGWVGTTLRACSPESRPFRHRRERRAWRAGQPTGAEPADPGSTGSPR